VDISDLASSPALQSLFAPASTPASTPAPSAPASSTTSPAVQAASLLASSESELFSSISGGASSGLPDLSGLTAAAQAYSLYTNPAMLQQLATGTAASAPSTPSTGAVFTAPAYSFNPFDEASWWSNPSALGTTVDATA
jgi:hypothetical protein